MKKETPTGSSTKTLTLMYEHNPYEVNIYTPKKSKGKTIVFPIFNYQADKQYIDLIYPIVEEGYKVISINLLNKGDRVLFFNYYYDVFGELIEDLNLKKMFGKDEVIVMGFGIGANLASYMNFYKSDDIKISKIILISPINKYKCDYKISKEIVNFQIPTHIFFGQFDKVVDIDTRYSMFVNGKNNPNVTFTCYPATGHYLYYDGLVSMEMEKLYRNSGFDMMVGESRKHKAPFLPSDRVSNKQFLTHLFNDIEGVPNPKRIALLGDLSPYLITGVKTDVELLQEELDKLGYETYVVFLWKKYNDFNLLPTNHHIPIIAQKVKEVPGYENLELLNTYSWGTNAKMLAMFGFSYLHLHTDYSMSKIAIELAKITGIKMPYTFHTTWRMYYENKLGKLAKDISYKSAKTLLYKNIYKQCPAIVTPSPKSQSLLQDDTHHKDVRVAPSPIDTDKFVLSKEDRIQVAQLRIKYRLKGKKILGYVGKISTEKNIVETIYYISQVVNEIPNLMFMIVSEGDATKQLQKYAKRLKVEDHIIYVGPVPHEELKLYYALFDVFVTASNFETQGSTYFEAANCGTLILAKEDKSLEGIFEDGKNAYLYDGFYSWLERLEKALFSDNLAITTEAKANMKQYSKDKWAKKMLALYTELNPAQK